MISSYRRELGVPPFFVRIHGGVYPPLDVKFSPFYPFNRCSVNKNVADVPGVYELRITDKKISYENDKTGIFYIGSAGNIKKRIKEHLSINGKNGGVLKNIKNNRCSFRYIAFYKNWRKEEKRLYKLFVSTFGSPPKCNRLSP